MKWLFVGLLVVHGALHFLGVAAGFGWADVPGLTQPVPGEMGGLWLLAALATLGTAAAVAVSWRNWWAVGLAAVALSQGAISGSWSDAWPGTVANAFVLLGVVYGFASRGPLSFRARYLAGVREDMGGAADDGAAPVTQERVAHLPGPVRRYLEATGTLGRPRTTHFRARWRGRIRATPDDDWMSFAAEQYDFIDGPSRYFHMAARRGGLPVDVLHEYASGEASMRVRLLSLFPLVDARGSDLRRAETVTVFNDLCLLAPSALLDPNVEWEAVDDHEARARYTSGAHTIAAVLRFDDEGQLVDFVSDDRLATPPGREPQPWRWSTPVSDYRFFGPTCAAARGSGLWHPPEGPFAYIELELLELELNPPAP